MKALHGSLRLRFIAGTATGLLLISMLYAVLAVVGKYISYTCGSILATFILAMFTIRANDRGVAIGFVCGIAMTAIVGNFSSINWLWYNLIGFLVSCITFNSFCCDDSIIATLHCQFC